VVFLFDRSVFECCGVHPTDFVSPNMVVCIVMNKFL
jgi:hypothetical protein